MVSTSDKIEIWKKVVDVQQHFNDLELRIRNFALIVTGAFLGLGGYAIKDGGFILIFNQYFSSAALIIWASLLPLCAFYLMDRLWYHRLLGGAVKAGIAIEQQLAADGVVVDLGTHISASSPFKLWFFGKTIHSRHKMDGFYCLLLFAIVLLALTLTLAIKPQNSTVSNNIPSRTPQQLDDAAAHAICDASAKALLSKSLGIPGAVLVDSVTGNQAVLSEGRWKLVPKCGPFP